MSAMQRPSLVPSLDQELCNIQVLLNEVVQSTHQLQQRVGVVEDSLRDAPRHDSQISAALLSEVRAELLSELRNNTFRADVDLSKFQDLEGNRPVYPKVSDEGTDAKSNGNNDDNRPQARARLENHQALKQTVPHTYSLNESVWDVAWLLGHRMLGIGGSIQMAALLLINIALQVTFVIICMKNFLGDDFGEDTISQFTIFRTSTAHSDTYMDRVTGSSLASRVCNTALHTSLAVATEQAYAVHSIESYLNSNAGWIDQFFAGRLMCLLAIYCWLMTVSEETRSCIDLFSAIHAQPLDRTTTMHLSDDGEVTITTISRRRRWFFYPIFIIRAFVQFLLALGGSLWLVYTDSIQNLLLNAVALQFVLSIAYLLFVSSAPAGARMLIATHKPLSMPYYLEWEGCDIYSALFVIIIPLGVSIMNFWKVDRVIENMRAAKHALCGGNQDFLYDVNALGMPFIAFTNWRPQDFSSESSQTPSARSVREAIALNPDAAPQTQFKHALNPFDYGLLSLRQVTRGSIAHQIDVINADCRDIVDTSEPFLNAVNYELTQEKVGVGLVQLGTACSALQHICNIVGSELAFIVRLGCSATCNCAAPDSLTPSHHGCPQSCFSGSKYRKALDTMPCEQPPANQLKDNDVFQSWIRILNVAPAVNFIEPGVVDILSQNGCDGLNNLSRGLEFCLGTNPALMRPMAILCPLSCGCKSPDGWRKGCMHGPYESCLLNSTRKP